MSVSPMWRHCAPTQFLHSHSDQFSKVLILGTHEHSSLLHCSIRILPKLAESQIILQSPLGLARMCSFDISLQNLGQSQQPTNFQLRIRTLKSHYKHEATDIYCASPHTSESRNARMQIFCAPCRICRSLQCCMHSSPTTCLQEHHIKVQTMQGLIKCF